MTVGKKYADSCRSSEFIPNLLKVDTPELFHGELGPKFCQFLTNYVRKHSLRNSFLKTFIQIMVSHILDCILSYSIVQSRCKVTHAINHDN